MFLHQVPRFRLRGRGDLARFWKSPVAENVREKMRRCRCLWDQSLGSSGVGYGQNLMILGSEKMERLRVRRYSSWSGWSGKWTALAAYSAAE